MVQPFTCKFLPLDIYPTTLKSEYSKADNTIGIGLQFSVTDPAIIFNTKKMFVQDAVLQKEEKLAKDMTAKAYNHRYILGTYAYDPASMMYAGVSGKTRVYSDKVVLGREPGENLNDLCVVLTLGRVRYPEMELIADGARDKQAPSWVCLPFGVYFSEGMVPGALTGNGVIVKLPGDAVLEEMTFFFEIPVTGMTLSGEEKSVVFKAQCVVK